MRTYHLTPTVLAVLVFCVLGNLVVLWTLPEETTNTANDDAWVLYYALVRTDEFPDRLVTGDLPELTGRLDDGAEIVGERFTVLDWSRSTYGFKLVVRHLDGSGFTITSEGVGHAG